jgi:hypothetical protein
MTTTPLTGYYSTGYYNNSITPIYITTPSTSGIKIAKAKDDNKLYAYLKQTGSIAPSSITIYPYASSSPAVPVVEADGSITGSLLAITSSPYISAGNPASHIIVDYDVASLAAVSFWNQGLSATGTWNDGDEYQGVRQYVNGALFTGIYQTTYFNDGLSGSTFRASDGKAYVNGKLFSGLVPGGTASNPLNWPNFNATIPAPTTTVMYTNGVSALLAVHRFMDGRLFLSNNPFTGIAVLSSNGRVLKFNRSIASRSVPVTIPLSAINSRFSSVLRSNIADIIFDQGYPITGFVNNLYHYKGLPTTNIALTSKEIYFRDGKIAHGVIGNNVYSYGVLISSK